LTWAADGRENRVRIDGERGSIALDGGRLELRSPGSDARSWDLPSIAEGSHHPEWFEGVLEEFLGEVREPAARGCNLEEAALCAELIALAQESSHRGGATVPVPAP
jgi:predicted dehydrogenase